MRDGIGAWHGIGGIGAGPQGALSVLVAQSRRRPRPNGGTEA